VGVPESAQTWPLLLPVNGGARVTYPAGGRLGLELPVHGPCRCSGSTWSSSPDACPYH